MAEVLFKMTFKAGPDGKMESAPSIAATVFNRALRECPVGSQFEVRLMLPENMGSYREAGAVVPSFKAARPIKVRDGDEYPADGLVRSWLGAEGFYMCGLFEKVG